MTAKRREAIAAPEMRAREMMRSSEEVLVTVAGDTLLGNEYANGMAGVGDALWASNNGEKGGRSEEGERDEMGGECADALDTSRSLRYSRTPRARSSNNVMGASVFSFRTLISSLPSTLKSSLTSPLTRASPSGNPFSRTT